MIAAGPPRECRPLLYLQPTPATYMTHRHAHHCLLRNQYLLMYFEGMKTTELDPARVARWFHAFADQTRIRIVDLLASGELCVCDLQGALGAAQSRLSFHLKVLREAGVVSGRKEGRWNYYSLRQEVLDEMAAYLQERKPDVATWNACGCGGDRVGRCCE